MTFTQEIVRDVLEELNKPMKKKPNYEPEFHEVKYRLPTGRLVCDCCYSPQGQPHTKYCYWNPTNKAKDDAAERARLRGDQYKPRRKPSPGEKGA